MRLNPRLVAAARAAVAHSLRSMYRRGSVYLASERTTEPADTRSIQNAPGAHAPLRLVLKKQGKAFVVDANRPGSPPIGRGSTMKAALGDWLHNNQRHAARKSR